MIKRFKSNLNYKIHKEHCEEACVTFKEKQTPQNISSAFTSTNLLRNFCSDSIHRKNKLANICSLNSTPNHMHFEERDQIFLNIMMYESTKVRDQIKQNERHETESFNEFDCLLFKQPMRYTQLMF